ncbi:hypothetical protein CCP3SC1_1020005 [Gammaproteobacteria bacterium]
MSHTDTKVVYFEHAALMRFGSAVVDEIKIHPHSREIAMKLVNHMKQTGEPPTDLDFSTTLSWFSSMLNEFDHSFAARVQSRVVA